MIPALIEKEKQLKQKIAQLEAEKAELTKK